MVFLLGAGAVSGAQPSGNMLLPRTLTLTPGKKEFAPGEMGEVLIQSSLAVSSN